ncbi:MAG: NAD(P)H-dependent oxidoreductase [Alphaproteobacteria bacterium]
MPQADPGGGRRILIVQGHPDPAGGHLCHALAEAYADGATAAGHRVRHIAVAACDFPLLRSQADFEHGAIPDGLVAAQEAVGWAEHVVLVFPLWLGGMPALLRGFLEQVLRPGFAFDYGPGLPRRRLKGRSAHIVVTMGMPALAYRWIFGAYALRALERSILAFVGIRPRRRSLFGGAATAPPARRARWLERMRRAGGRAR